MTIFRAKFAGVLGILQYNWHYYATSLCAILCIWALLWLRLLPRTVGIALIVAAAVVAFWSLISVLASYYIYDHAGVTRWGWIPSTLSFPPRRWLNIHAGLDESTLALSRLLPNTRYEALDIYDSREMTEPSIARARLMRAPAQPALVGKLDALPLPDRDRDTLFVLFAAHEIRQPDRRAEFFREVARVMANSGQLVLVEHLRDWKNFVAFGPGFLHFYSRREWLRLAKTARLTIEHEVSATPFVRCFLMRKAEA